MCAREEEINKLTSLKEEFIRINNLYNEKLYLINDLNEQINNYNENKRHKKVWYIFLLLFIGFYGMDSLLEHYIPSYVNIELIIEIITTISWILVFQIANGSVAQKLFDLKELLKRTEEERKKLYPELCKKREEYQTLEKNIDEYNAKYSKNGEKTINTTTSKHYIQTINYQDVLTQDSNKMKTLTLP